MFYRLNQNYALRGWEKTNGALIDRSGLFVRALRQRAFSLLLLCDGQTDFSALPLSDDERETLKNLEKKQIIENSAEPRPIDSWQQYVFFPNRYVKSAFWSMTGRCNYHCRHCFMDAPDGALGEISHEEAVSLIDQMAECGIMRAELSGGEPFVRKDFWDLIDRMKEKNITVNMVYSNGFLLDDRALDGFEKRSMKPEFSISFDGVGWHDWIRGVPGAEKVALDALKRCMARGFPVNVEMCLHKGNVSSLRETVRLLSGIGVPKLKVSRISDTELWKKNNEGNALDIREYIEAMIAYIPEYYEDDLPVYIVLCDAAILRTDRIDDYEIIAEKYSGGEDALDCLSCGAMRSSCYISPEGRILPCMPFTACEAQKQFPRFQDIGLRNGLSGSFYMQYVDKRIRDVIEANPKCSACSKKLVCGGGCRASALETTGDIMGPDTDQCFLWENGYVDRIRRTVEDSVAKYKAGKGTAENEN